MRSPQHRHRPGHFLLGTAMAAALLYPSLTRAADPDGLQRFEKLLPTLQAELKKDGGAQFRYGHGSAIGNSGFALDDVTVDIPADAGKAGSKPSKVAVKRIVVEDLDFARIDVTTPGAPTTAPYFAKLAVQGMSIDGDMQERMKALGLPPATLDLALDYRYDEPRKMLTLNKLEMQLPGLASLVFTMILDGVPPPGPDSAKQAQDNVTLRTATLSYDDHSLLGRVLPVGAALAGMQVDQGIDMMRETLGAMLQGQSAASMANADALVSFAVDWQAPKGKLEIRLTPASNASFAALKTVDSPDAAQKILGLAITYGGTRAGAATASATPAPATPAPSAPPAAGATASDGLCSSNGRVFVRDQDDGSLSAATVIEATGGGRCIVRMDGAAKGDDTVAATGDLRRWSIDGPGDPLASCEKGKSVLALSDGTWTPGKVQASGKAGKCEVKLEDQDDSEELPLASIRVASDH